MSHRRFKIFCFSLFLAGICFLEVNLYNLYYLRNSLLPREQYICGAISILPALYLQGWLKVLGLVFSSRCFISKVSDCPISEESFAFQTNAIKLDIDSGHNFYSWLNYVKTRRIALKLANEGYNGFVIAPLQIHGKNLERILLHISGAKAVCKTDKTIIYLVG
ncbi:MAG: hypothetical protein NZO16_01465 [Deltaproteobacteria bacterium]|nr:hypothetical protein [Deltaproteobacteria bacterium]